jgi:hypothetical protein
MTTLPAALAAIVTAQRELAELRIQATAARRAALVEELLRDDLAEARREAAHYRGMYRACLQAACEHITRANRRWDTIEAQRDQMRETRRVMWLACMLAVTVGQSRDGGQ